MKYLVMDANRNILDDDFDLLSAREWCVNYSWLTGRASFVLRQDYDGFYELVEVVK